MLPVYVNACIFLGTISILNDVNPFTTQVQWQCFDKTSSHVALYPTEQSDYSLLKSSELLDIEL